ncbi:hypothetical protein BOSEA1005_10276 [Hyphomicrobiales bacterium]|nr:hypothetical protein BOSEA1005_10276 [Hyphomicrobiales bacterium]
MHLTPSSDEHAAFRPGRMGHLQVPGLRFTPHSSLSAAACSRTFHRLRTTECISLMQAR